MSSRSGTVAVRVKGQALYPRHWAHSRHCLGRRVAKRSRGVARLQSQTGVSADAACCGSTLPSASASLSQGPSALV